MHAVWLAKKIIELACSGTLAQAAQDYTLELNRAGRARARHRHRVKHRATRCA